MTKDCQCFTLVDYNNDKKIIHTLLHTLLVHKCGTHSLGIVLKARKKKQLDLK